VGGWIFEFVRMHIACCDIYPEDLETVRTHSLPHTHGQGAENKGVVTVSGGGG